MPEIRLNGAEVETVYDLLGRKENDITYALGWGLSQSSALLARFLELCGASDKGSDAAQIDLQLHGKRPDHAGITDIEIVTPSAHVIVEAKRGWNLPSEAQLRKYAPRLANTKNGRIVVLTQWGEENYVRSLLGAEVDGLPISTVGLGDVAHAADAVVRQERTVRARQVVSELGRYLVTVAELRHPHDNRVYVVSLSEHTSEAGVSYVEVVEKLQIYWYPAAGRGGWPKTPPNYMGFRYRGRLQSLHHVDGASLVARLSDAVEVVDKGSDWGPAFVLRLGDPIPLPNRIPTGKKIVRSARRLIDLDLLLTSPTISDAYARTVERHRAP